MLEFYVSLDALHFSYHVFHIFEESSAKRMLCTQGELPVLRVDAAVMPTVVTVWSPKSLENFKYTKSFPKSYTRT